MITHHEGRRKALKERELRHTMSFPSRIISESRKRALTIARGSHNPFGNIGIAMCSRFRPAVLERRVVHAAASSSSSKAASATSSNHGIHSSAVDPHAAGAAAAHIIGGAEPVTPSVPLPTTSQLKTLFVSSAIPMVGFGFMDNFIMIQAGGYIDATLGVQFGLATLTAAAMGQVVSDVSGVVFGGTLERFLERMKLMKASNLSAAQRQLPISRNIAMAGGVMGVIFGCLLGATSLMFVDLEAHDRQKHAKDLEGMLSSILSEHEHGEASMGCEGCVVYLKSPTNIPIGYTYDENAQKPELKLLQDVEGHSLVKHCEKCQKVVVDNHCSDGGFGVSKSQLCAPVISEDGQVVAVLDFHNKHAKRGSKLVDTSFTDDDERTARILARHIAIFMDRISST